jgi:ribose transport system ATP-binding protein
MTQTSLAANDRERLLRMTGIGKAFAGVPVLDDVSFDLHPGEVHILAGENGAGKTTLIKILTGVHTEYMGSILLGERPVRFKSPQDAARHGISVIHQEMSLVNAMTVSDNIFLGREILKRGSRVDFRAQNREALRLLSRFGIEVSLSKRLEEYPVSVRQMIEIAKALAQDARIIVMDEPTSALNDLETSRLFQFIADLKKNGCGVVYITHRMEEIYRIGDRISVLRDGRLIGCSPIGDLGQDLLVNWMVGRDLGRQFPPRQASPEKTCLSIKDLSLLDPRGVTSLLVEGVGFQLHQGEILGFAGLQGSGKSELFHGIFGTRGRPASGTVLLDGQPFVPRSPLKSIERGLALLTNDRKETGLIPPLSIANNISLACLPSLASRGWINRQREREAAARNFRFFNIKARSVDQEVRTLSGGNQQKVVLAKWLETKPKVLLLDEPTIGVDVGAKQEIYKLMNDWTSRGIGILLITSELPELLAMSDRILVMHRGRIRKEFDRAEATQEKVIKAAMGEDN